MSQTYIPVELRRLVRQRAGECCELVAGRIEARTAIGRVTVRLLQLNLPDRIEERQLLLEAGLLQMPEQSQ